MNRSFKWNAEEMVHDIFGYLFIVPWCLTGTEMKRFAILQYCLCTYRGKRILYLFQSWSNSFSAKQLRLSDSNKKFLKFYIKIIARFGIFFLLLGYPMANLGPLSRGQPQYPNVNHCIFNPCFDMKVTRIFVTWLDPRVRQSA